MATSKVFFAHLRRSRLLSTLSTARHSHSPRASDPTPFSSPSPLPPLHPSLMPPFSSGLNFPATFCSRSFSTRSSDDSELSGDSFSELPTSSEHINVGLNKVAEEVVSGSGGSSILPVDGLISILDWTHDFTGLPWWIIIASSTVAMRLTVFPLLILQLNKLKRVGECFPNLPPPLPPPLSQKSYVDQFLLFREKRLAMGCPSYLWLPAFLLVQVPCFILWMTTIRRMSLDHHPGFDTGGALWFQNLTEFSHGFSGPIFPLLIAGLHFINVQISFGMSSAGKVTGWLGLLAKYYRMYLNLLTLPLIFFGYCVPQGSLVYWATNSSLTVMQQLALKQPAIRAKLGLEEIIPRAPLDSDKFGAEFMTFVDSANQQRKVSVQKLSPTELFNLSVKQLTKGKKDKAIPLLQLAIKKDPEFIRPLIVLAQTLLQKGMLDEAAQHLEHAISKLYFFGEPTDVEGVDLLMLASLWAGNVNIKQGKWEEGMIHLERIANLKEPEEARSKAHYYDALVYLSSALLNLGRKDEALKYLRLAAAYNPAYNVYLEQCEKDDDFVSDLTTSRRGDF